MKVLFLKGLPASGKSTFAKELVAKEPDRWVRVNKDGLRQLLHDGKWSKGREKLVQQMERSMAEEALRSGLSVVVDDTNLAAKHEATFRQIAERHGAEFEVRFFDLPVETCIERDLKRSSPVGKDVILRMFYQHLCEPSPAFEKALPMAIICDLDGTLAKMKDRGPFEWSKVGQDDLNDPVYDAVCSMAEDAQLLIVSGRDGSCESQTRDWLLRQGIDPAHLFMRPAGNMEKDSVIKRRIYDEHIRGKYNVLAVFDDRPQVVRLWRSLGLFVFDCGNGVEF